MDSKYNRSPIQKTSPLDTANFGHLPAIGPRSLSLPYLLGDVSQSAYLRRSASDIDWHLWYSRYLDRGFPIDGSALIFAQVIVELPDIVAKKQSCSSQLALER